MMPKHEEAVGLRTYRAAASRGVVFVVLLLTSAPANAQPMQPLLTPANFNHQTDSLGFRWDVTQTGSINDGTSDCFDGGLVLRTGRTQFQCSQPQMSSANNEYVLSGKLGNIQVTRRVKIDVQRSFARYVESFTNPGAVPTTLAFTIYTNLGSTAQSVTTNEGRVVGGPLTRKENVVVCLQQSRSSRPTAVMYFGNARSKVKPSVAMQSGNVLVNVSVTIQPGRTVSFLHAVAQRRFPTLPDSKALDALVKPLRRAAFVEDLPSSIRRTIVNYGTMLFGGDLGQDGLLTLDLSRALGVQPGSSDILAIGEKGRLRGTASCEALAIATRFGKVELAWERVAALAGRRHTSGEDQVYLRDGQKLTGTLSAEGLCLATVIGASAELSVASLDRLVMGQGKNREPQVDDSIVYALTTTSDRLAVSFAEDARLPLLTMWGDLDVRLQDIAWLVPAEDDAPGYEVRLKDGGRFFAYVRDGMLKAHSTLIGDRELRTTDLRGLLAAEVAKSLDDYESPSRQAHLVLRGGQVMVGGFVDDALKLRAEGEALPVPCDQIRGMKRRDPDDELLPNPTPRFATQLWSGEVIMGILDDAMFTVQVADQTCHVPVRDLMEFNNRLPHVSQEDQTRIRELISRLGDDDWRARKRADQQLADIGYAAVPLLQEAAKSSQDPEIRRSARALADRLDVFWDMEQP